MAHGSKIPAFAAVAVLGLIASKLTRRRVRIGFFLFRLAVAFGESWSDRRARRSVARVLAASEKSSAVESPVLRGHA
ncbi:MAG TPA: hypothetical protein VHO02_05375 [Fibrobacteria bacterium]|jgi:hypothetical protein|nr:hypothetical protein [Fibrobacteria bacterium]